MTSTALFCYLRIVGDLLHSRAVQGTTEDDEEAYGIKLDGYWQQMAPEECKQAEAFIAKRLAITAPDELPQTEDFDPTQVHQRPRKMA